MAAKRVQSSRKTGRWAISLGRCFEATAKRRRATSEPRQPLKGPRLARQRQAYDPCPQTRAAQRALRALEGRCAGVGSLRPPEVPSASLRAIAEGLRAVPSDLNDPERFALAQDQLAPYCDWMAEEATPHERSASEVLTDLDQPVEPRRAEAPS